ncbi:hypothetical protein DE146DRAFT_762829 [Phaeosphaeria sp. MPI-PUGE-AT-0046c]|nr:hypothetical protein DE146DRAFT_762829 [Phaeosphaeria sp. MPI-PUGE-AT-0046c]
MDELVRVCYGAHIPINLDQITHEQRMDQMVKNEMAIRNIIGKCPAYMRPPYSACESAACQVDLKALGYVVTSFDLDTDDYNQLTKEKIQTAKNNSRTVSTPLAQRTEPHCLHAGIRLLNGFTAVAVGECMNYPVANWYRESAPGVKPSPTPSSSASAPTPMGSTSLNGECGTASSHFSIGFNGPDGLSECCFPAGWCGRADAYCGTGCNTLFGKCGPQPAISASDFVSVSKTSAAPVPTVSLETSTTGECGATIAQICKGFLIDSVKAECCSEYNWCGNSESHCGATCNPLYGNCGSSGSSSTVSVTASASTIVSSHSTASATPSASPSPSGPTCGKSIYPTRDAGLYANSRDTTLDSCTALCTSDSARSRDDVRRTRGRVVLGAMRSMETATSTRFG